MSSAPTPNATNRHRPDEVGAESAGRDPRARGAILALAVAAIGTVGFVVGLRIALDRAPAEERPVGTDSARTAAGYDSVGAARRRSEPRAPDQSQSGERDDLPRLR